MKKAPKKAPAKKKKPAAAAKKKSATPKAKPKTSAAPSGDASAYIAQRIKDIGGWRGALLGRIRSLILEADPDIVEERKWIKPSNPHGVPTYSHGGMVMTLEVYQDHVKVTFAYGSKVKDPAKLFNASLLGLRRAMDMTEGQTLDAAAFKKLVKDAVAVNLSK